jgi:uncharacterized membrane protein YcaP (DUF421 family)
VLELFVRGTVMYLVVFLFLRLTGRRALGEVSLLDMIFVIMIAVGAQNAILGDHSAIGSGLVLVLTLVFWNVLLSWVTYRYPRVERFFTPPPIKIIEDGRLLSRNMRREMITREELFAHLREQGVEDISQVKLAYIEGDGEFSVIPMEQ